MAANDRKSRVFLSYASEDLDTVRQVYEGLIKRGLDLWFDKEHLGPGKWKPQITRAITKSRYFVICLSNAAIRKTGDKPGFQDEELNEAYEIAKNQPESEFAIIPVRLEDCDRGDHRITLYQQYDLFEDFEEGLNIMAVDMGGISLSDATARDERTDYERLIDNIFAKATTEYIAGKYRDSFKLFDSILDVAPDNIGALYYKGVTLQELDKLDEAVEAYNKALKIDPNNSMCWYSKGYALKKLGKFVESIEAYNTAIKTNPNFASAWYNKGNSLKELGKLGESIEAYDRALKIKPDLILAWCNKGGALIEFGKLDEAIEAYDKALQINPDHANAWYNKGIALARLNKHGEALAAFSKALELNPDDTDASKYRDKVMKQLEGSG